MPPSPVTPDPAQRAAELRRLAHRLCTLAVHELPRLAGPDTWVGALPQQCHHDLAWHTRALAREAEQLVATARRLEHDQQLSAP